MRQTHLRILPIIQVDKKIESVTLLEFNAYVVDSTPHVRLFTY